MSNIIVLQWVQIVLFILTLVIAIRSIKIANRSLREAEKARRDTFLPIVIVTAIWSSARNPKKGEILFRNWGHGIAFDVRAFLPGTGEVPLALQFLDPSEPQSRPIGFQLPNSGILDDPHIRLFYKDIFGRIVETSYRVIPTEKEDGVYNVSLANEKPTIVLPR